MDEVMGVEVQELPVRGLVGVLAVLLGIILIVDQTFWGMMDGALDGLLVPIVKAQESDFGKVQVRTLYRENEGMEREKDLLLEARVIPEESGLLLKDAVPVPAAAELVLPENPSDGEAAARTAIPNILQPQAEGTDTEPAVSKDNGLSMGPTVQENQKLSAEPGVPEAIMPATEVPSVIVAEYLPDTPAIVEEIVSNLSEPEKVVPEILPDISTPVKVVAEDLKKPSVAVSEQQPEPPVSAEVTAPAPVEPDAIVPEKSAEEPIIPEPVVPAPEIPDTEILDNGVTDDVPADIVGEEGGEALPVSCFLLDEAGMLYGFLPEYAGIADGCLELPAECTGIRSGAFSGCGAGIVELYIPAGAAVIEEGAFSGLDGLEWIEVEGGNPGYASDFGVLFDSTMSVLVKFPGGRVSAYSMPPYVTAVADGAFEGASIYKLDIRNCAYVSFGGNAFGYSAGNGMEIAVPEAQFDMYTQMLSGYAVTLTK